MYNVDIYVNYFVIEKFDVYDYFSDIRLIFFFFFLARVCKSHSISTSVYKKTLGRGMRGERKIHKHAAFVSTRESYAKKPYKTVKNVY